MKIIVAIVVFNRYNNLERWLNIWEQSEQGNLDFHAELVVIHTGDEVEKFKLLCSRVKLSCGGMGVNYIHRKNVGFDIGCMQDVFKERLPGFADDWDYLLWVTDDTFPMSKDFISPFINKIQEPGVGVSAMQISKAVSPHIRTTGFCISKELSKKIVFPADPITTKAQCYFYEHRGGMQTFTNQVRAMGLSCEQVAPNKTSPLWDQGYWRRLDREQELEQVFPTGKKKGDKTLFIVPIYHNYPQIISSLICQTVPDWELMLVHDGPSNNGLSEQIKTYNDKRISYSETSEHRGKWGHYIRKESLEQIKDRTDIAHVVISNPDNYYCPEFLRYMLKGINSKHTAVASYCSHIVHSYIAHKVMTSKIERGFIDCGSVLIKKDIACEVGWRDVDEHSADWTFFSDIASRYSTSNFISVPGALFVHN